MLVSRIDMIYSFKLILQTPRHLSSFSSTPSAHSRPTMATVARPMMPRHSSTPVLQSRDAVTKMTREDTRALRDFFNETGPPLPVLIDNTHQRMPSFGTSSIGKAKAKKLSLFKSKKKAEADDEKAGPRIRTPPPGTVAITLNSGYVATSVTFTRPCSHVLTIDILCT